MTTSSFTRWTLSRAGCCSTSVALCCAGWLGSWESGLATSARSMRLRLLAGCSPMFPCGGATLPHLTFVGYLMAMFCRLRDVKPCWYMGLWVTGHTVHGHNRGSDPGNAVGQTQYGLYLTCASPWGGAFPEKAWVLLPASMRRSPPARHRAALPLSFSRGSKGWKDVKPSGWASPQSTRSWHSCSLKAGSFPHASMTSGKTCDHAFMIPLSQRCPRTSHVWPGKSLGHGEALGMCHLACDT